MSMKVLLIAPPHLNNDPPYEAKPPLGLMYIAASIERDGHTVRVYDMYSFPNTIPEIIDIVQEFQPKVIGFSLTTPMVKSGSQIAEAIKKVWQGPIIVGGPHISSLPERSLQEFPAFDICVKGEGEATTRELVTALEKGLPLAQVNGLIYRENGKTVSTPPRDLVDDLDSLPMPAYHLVAMQKYLKDASVTQGKGARAFSMFSARGCPAKCIFCDSNTTWTRRYRAHSAKRVVDEMEHLKKKYGIGHIFFYDDVFVINRHRAIEVCDDLIRRKLKISWQCFGRVDFMTKQDAQDKELLTKMRNAGCVRQFFGIESGDQPTLDFMQKGITLEEVHHAIAITRKVGIKTAGFWIIGFPNEDEKAVWNTINFNLGLPLDDHGDLSILIPYPGTESYHVCVKEGLLLSEDWDRFTLKKVSLQNLPPIKTRHLSPEQLYHLKIQGDKLLMAATYRKKFRYYFKHPYEALIRVAKNPRSFLDRLRFLASARYRNVYFHG